MKMKPSRMLMICLLLLPCLLLSGCGEVPPPADGDTSPPPNFEDDAPYTIGGADLAKFTIVRSEFANNEEKQACVTFRDTLNALCGTELSLITDYLGASETPSSHEIVIGKTNREGSPALPGEGCAGVYVKDGKLFLRADEAAMLTALVHQFLKEIQADGQAAAAPFALKEGYMKEYQSHAALIRTDGGQVKTESAYSDYDYGITGHHRGYAAYPETQLETQIRLAAELGVRIYRFNFNPQSDDDFAYMDRVLDLCDAYGLKMMLVLDEYKGTPAQLSQMHEQIAKRYRGRIAYYQIFNETDVYAMHKDDGTIYHQPVGTGEVLAHFNPERVSEITEKLRASIAVFREHDPDAKLVVNFSYRHYAILKAFVDAGLSWDVIGVDWYSNMGTHEVFEQFLLNVQKELPDFEYMICECNIWAHDVFTEEQRTQYLETLVGALADSDVENLTAIIFYELLDEPAFGNGESYFGFVENDIHGKPGIKKPIYTAMQQHLCGGEVTFGTVLTERK